MNYWTNRLQLSAVALALTIPPNYTLGQTNWVVTSRALDYVDAVRPGYSATVLSASTCEITSREKLRSLP